MEPSWVIVAKAFEFGVVPALALILVLSMHRQNKQLIEKKEKAESQLLQLLLDTANESKDKITALYERLEQRRAGHED